MSGGVQANFHTDCRGIQAQLLGLSSLMSILDPQLTSFLVSTVPLAPFLPRQAPHFHELLKGQLCQPESGAEDIAPL